MEDGTGLGRCLSLVSNSWLFSVCVSVVTPREICKRLSLQEDSEVSGYGMGSEPMCPTVSELHGHHVSRRHKSAPVATEVVGACSMFSRLANLASEYYCYSKSSPLTADRTGRGSLRTSSREMESHTTESRDVILPSDVTTVREQWHASRR